MLYLAFFRKSFEGLGGVRIFLKIPIHFRFTGGQLQNKYTKSFKFDILLHLMSESVIEFDFFPNLLSD